MNQNILNTQYEGICRPIELFLKWGGVQYEENVVNERLYHTITVLS